MFRFVFVGLGPVILVFVGMGVAVGGEMIVEVGATVGVEMIIGVGATRGVGITVGVGSTVTVGPIVRVSITVGIVGKVAMVNVSTFVGAPVELGTGGSDFVLVGTITNVVKVGDIFVDVICVLGDTVAVDNKPLLMSESREMTVTRSELTSDVGVEVGVLLGVVGGSLMSVSALDSLTNDVIIQLITRTRSIDHGKYLTHPVAELSLRELVFSLLVMYMPCFFERPIWQKLAWWEYDEFPAEAMPKIL